MSDFELIRVASIPAGVFGVLKHLGAPFAVTLEHGYEDDKPKIPPGLYRCPRVMYNKGGYWSYLIPVPGHSEIKFHIANTERDVDGCVGVGESFGVLKESPAILDSGRGFAEFMLLAHDAPEIWLLVREC